MPSGELEPLSSEPEESASAESAEPSALQREWPNLSIQSGSSSRSLPAGADSWSEYGTHSAAQTLPGLAEAPATLPLSGEEGSEGIEPRPVRERDVAPGWLSHGVLGPLAAGTVPEAGAYRMAKPAVDTFGVHLSQVPRASLAEIMVKVVEVESPVLVSDVATRVARAAGLGKVRHSTEKAFREAASYAASNHLLALRGEVLWSNRDDAVVVRDRSKCPSTVRLTESVPPEELEWAVHRSVWAAGAIRRDDLPRATAQLLGFHRTSEQLRSRVEAALRKALDAGDMVESGGLISLVHGGPAPRAVGAKGPKTEGGPSRIPESQAGEQARLLIASLPSSSSRRVVLKQIHNLGPDAIGPLIEALADSRLAPFAVTALVEFGPLAKEQLVRALHSTNTQIVIHAGEVLSRAGLDEGL